MNIFRESENLDPFCPGYLKIFLLFQGVSKLSVPRVFLID